VILDDSDKLFVIVHADTAIFFSIVQRDLQGPIGAAIIDDNILKITVGLAENALNTLRQKILAIVDGGKHAYERFLT